MMIVVSIATITTIAIDIIIITIIIIIIITTTTTTCSDDSCTSIAVDSGNCTPSHETFRVRS